MGISAGDTTTSQAFTGRGRKKKLCLSGPSRKRSSPCICHAVAKVRLRIWLPADCTLPRRCRTTRSTSRARTDVLEAETADESRPRAARQYENEVGADIDGRTGRAQRSRRTNRSDKSANTRAATSYRWMGVNAQFLFRLYSSMTRLVLQAQANCHRALTCFLVTCSQQSA